MDKTNTEVIPLSTAEKMTRAQLIAVMLCHTAPGSIWVRDLRRGAPGILKLGLINRLRDMGVVL